MNGRSQIGGFTLLELIAVMGIIVAMSLVVVSSYTGIMSAISKNAGPRAFRNALTLCRQHASVDGQRTYVWIIDVDKYILCRKAGVVQGEPYPPKWGTLSGLEIPGYLGDSKISSVGPALWVYDRDADLGRGSLEFGGDDAALDFIRMLQGKEGREKAGSYYVFDFTENAMARVIYPPWHNRRGGNWVFGVAGLRFSGGSFSSNPRGENSKAFMPGNEYGWTLFAEQQLPQGYAFGKELYTLDSSGNFEKGKCVFFEADGSAPSDGNTLEFMIFEVNTDKKVTVKIETSGKIKIVEG